MEPLVTGKVDVDSLWNRLSDVEKSRILMDNISIIPAIDIKTTLFLLPPTIEEVGRAYAKNGRVAWFGRGEDESFSVRIDQDQGAVILITDMYLYKPDAVKGLTIDDLAGFIDITETGGLDVSMEEVPIEEYEPLLAFDSVDLLTTYTVLKEREAILGLPDGTAVKRVKHLLDELTFRESDIDGHYVPREGDVEKMVQLYANYIMFGNTFEDMHMLIVEESGMGYEIEDIADVWSTYTNPVVQAILEGQVYDLLKQHIPGW